MAKKIKTVRMINGLTEKDIKVLPDSSNFESYSTKTSPSSYLISESVRFRICAKKNMFDARYIEAIIILNLKTNDVHVVDEDANKILDTNMFTLKQDLTSTMEEAKIAVRKNNDLECAEKLCIKAILIKHIYTHYASLYTHISPDVFDKVK